MTTRTMVEDERTVGRANEDSVMRARMMAEMTATTAVMTIGMSVEPAMGDAAASMTKASMSRAMAALKSTALCSAGRRTRRPILFRRRVRQRRHTGYQL